LKSTETCLYGAAYLLRDPISAISAR